MTGILDFFESLLRLNLERAPFFTYPIVFAAGVLTSFTPCVYPLIPVIIGYIGGKQEKKRLKILFLSLFYVAGVSVTYASLGLFAALSGKVFGQVQANPLAYIVVASVIFLFGLSMLDVFSLPVPAFLRRKRTGKTKKASFSAAFSLGLASGFVAFPCTGPVLGVLLTYVASRQNLFFGASLLFVFALGMGTLLVLAGTFTGVLLALPKAGRWTVKIKKFFGWAMLVLAQYFFIQAGRFIC